VLEQIEHLDAPVLQRLLRRTVILSLIVGGAAVFLALLVGAPLAAVGIVAGLSLAIVNLRFLDAGVAKVQGTGEGSGKVLRRMLRTKTAWRLAAITVIAVAALLLSFQLGVGLVIGLVVYQILFVVAVARIIFDQGGAL
jgi:hypothetical protein